MCVMGGLCYNLCNMQQLHQRAAKDGSFERLPLLIPPNQIFHIMTTYIIYYEYNKNSIILYINFIH